MSLFYSASSNGFFDSAINGTSIPSDAVEISVDLHQELLAGQSAGKAIVAGENGFPVLKEVVFVPSWASVRAKRQALRAACDWTQLLDVRERLGDAKCAEWDEYRRKLTAITTDFASPELIVWPEEPK